MSNRRRGFTLAELLIVIGIIALLLSLLLPALASARRTARARYCSSQLRTLGQLMTFYASDNRGLFMDFNRWPLGRSNLTPLISLSGEWTDTDPPEGLQCPTAEEPEILSYIINGWADFRRCKLGQIGNGSLEPSRAVLVGENLAFSNRDTTLVSYTPVFDYKDENRHGALRSNHLFADMHVGNEIVSPPVPHWDNWYIPEPGRKRDD